jgi:hypothetical protein
LKSFELNFKPGENFSEYFKKLLINSLREKIESYSKLCKLFSFNMYFFLERKRESIELKQKMEFLSSKMTRSSGSFNSKSKSVWRKCFNALFKLNIMPQFISQIYDFTGLDSIYEFDFLQLKMISATLHRTHFNENSWTSLF